MIQLRYSPGINSFLQTNQKIKTRYRPNLVDDLSQDLVKQCNLFVGSTLSVEDIKALAETLSKPLNTGPGTFIGLLQYFRVYPLTNSGLLFLCRQLSSKRRMIPGAKSVDIFRGSLTHQWFPCEVVEVLQGEGFNHYLKCMFTEGEAAGLHFKLLLKNPSNCYRFILEAGISKKALRGSKLNPSELTKFKYYALVCPEAFTALNPEGNINSLPTYLIGGLRSTGTQHTHNKQLFSTRREPCPVNLRLPCNDCFVGLDTCPRACRISTNWAVNNHPPQEIRFV